MLTCRVLSLVVLAFRGELAKDAELLVLRHENEVLRRHVGLVRYEPADRTWLAALARPVPRKRWAEAFPVTPATLLAWHRRLAAGKYDTRKRRKPGHPPANPGSSSGTPGTGSGTGGPPARSPPRSRPLPCPAAAARTGREPAATPSGSPGRLPGQRPSWPRSGQSHQSGKPVPPAHPPGAAAAPSDHQDRTAHMLTEATSASCTTRRTRPRKVCQSPKWSRRTQLSGQTAARVLKRGTRRYWQALVPM